MNTLDWDLEEMHRPYLDCDFCHAFRSACLRRQLVDLVLPCEHLVPPVRYHHSKKKKRVGRSIELVLSMVPVHMARKYISLTSDAAA